MLILFMVIVTHENQREQPSTTINKKKKQINIHSRIKRQQLFMKICVKSVEVIPTHETHTQIWKNRCIHFEYATDKLYNSEYFVLFNGFELKRNEWDIQNNLHIIICDCSSMTRHLYIVCVYFFAAHRSVTQSKQERSNECW